MKNVFQYSKSCRMKQMQGNVFVVGASGDIGISICKKLADQGFQLILHYNKNKASVQKIRDELPEHAILMEIQADLRDEYNLEKLLETIVFPVDYLVFASGASDYGLFQNVTSERINEMVDFHVKSTEMIKKQLGKIILITSVWGDIGASNEVLYSTVKGAQNTFVKALAKEMGPSNIQVNAVSPGFIDTKMNGHLLDEERNEIISDIPLNRAGKPEDIANMVNFLLSEEASYIQGQIIQVSGGW